MIINRANMDALFATFNTKFTDAQKKAQGRAFENDLLLSELALVMSVGGAATVHPWLDAVWRSYA